MIDYALLLIRLLFVALLYLFLFAIMKTGIGAVRGQRKQTKNWTPLSLTRHWSCGIKWLPTWTRPS